MQTVMVSHAEMQSFDVRLRMMRDAAASIAFLHSRGVMHCDIKSLNFLVDEVSRSAESVCMHKYPL